MTRSRLALALVVLLAARTGGAETEVRVTADRVDVRSDGATVAELLDRLARQTGMKVVYDGAPPRGRISVNLAGLTPAQAVLAILEGQGLNYALRMDRSSTRIEQLLLVAGTGAVPPPPPPPRPEVPRLFQRDRDPEPPEVEEEPAAEAPEADENEVRPPTVPGIGFPSGPAVPLTLPTPPPPAPAPANPQQDSRPQQLRGNRLLDSK